KQARSHDCDGLIDRAEKRGVRARAARDLLRVQGGEQLQIAYGDRVENHGILLLVIADGVQMGQSRAAGSVRRGRSFPKVMYERARSANGLGMRGEAEAFQSGDAELLGEQTLSIVGAKDPFFVTRLDSFLRGTGGAFGAPRGTERREEFRLAG